MTTEEEVVWQPVSNGGDFNDFPLAFVNVDKETDEVSFNIDGEDVEPEDTPGPMIREPSRESQTFPATATLSQVSRSWLKVRKTNAPTH